jgi:hypothetical protein
MEIFVKQTRNDSYQVSLQNLDMSLPLKVITNSGEQTIRVGKKPVLVKSTTLPIIDPDKYYLTRIVFE